MFITTEEEKGSKCEAENISKGSHISNWDWFANI